MAYGDDDLIPVLLAAARPHPVPARGTAPPEISRRGIGGDHGGPAQPSASLIRSIRSSALAPQPSTPSGTSGRNRS